MNKFLILILTLLIHTQLCAQSDDFEPFTALVGSEPTVEINLGSTMLSLLSAATDDENKGVAKILSSLNSIRVTVYELNEKTQLLPIKSQINLLTDNQSKSGLEKIASIKEDDSLVYVFADVQDQQFKSLKITALDDEDELVLITIDGNILVKDIGDLLHHFDVDVNLNSLGAVNNVKNKE